MEPRRTLPLFLSLVVGLAPRADAQAPLRGFAGTDGQVTAIARSGETIYLAGWFASVGTVMGGGIPVNLTSGAPLPGSPEVAGTVNAVVPDGAGGWFIGGDFVGVGGVPRHDLAHLLADGGVAEWDPAPAGGAVACLALAGNTLYVGGAFTEIDGQGRLHLAAVDTRTGAARAWKPDPSGPVSALLVRGHSVYVGGEFEAIGGSSRRNLAVLDARTAAPAPLDPEPNGPVLALAIQGPTLYIGGAFTAVGGHPKGCLAAVDAVSGHVTEWGAGVGPRRESSEHLSVQALVATPNRIYVGGSFGRANGELRASLASFDRWTGEVTGWDPMPLSGESNLLYWPARVNALDVHDGVVRVGGASLFYCCDLDRYPAQFLKSFDAETGVRTDWQPAPNGPVNALAHQEGKVFVGGAFTGAWDWQRREGLAALDARTGKVTPWRANIQLYTGTHTLAVAGGQLFVGGEFEDGHTPTRNFASFDAITGAMTHAGSRADLEVFALKSSETTVFAGGRFDSIGGAVRLGIAAVEAGTGTAAPWNPSCDGAVRSLDVSGRTLYVGGDYGEIGGERRSNVAALDAVTGTATSWAPGADSYVTALCVDGTVVYAGGAFWHIGGQARHYLAALDLTTGEATDWDPDVVPSSDVFWFRPPIAALATAPGIVYAGGSFSAIGGRARSCLAALDAATGRATDWDPDLNGSVAALDADGNRVVVGGSFARAGLWPTNHLAAFPAATPVAPPVGRGPIRPPDPALTLEPANPARASASIAYSLPAAAAVTLAVYDLAGRRIASLLDRSPQSAGAHRVQVRTTGWPAGVYLCRIEAGADVLTRKWVVIR